MNKSYLTTLTLLTLMILSACGPTPTPTLSVADLQGTAMADAWVSITQTQAAMPTATASPIPTVTFTPPPSATPMPISTLAPIQPAAQITATENPCNLPPPIKPKGATAQAKFVNKSGGNVNLSFYMNAPNSDGECGTYTVVLGKFDDPVVTVLAGCYGAYAWINGDKPSNAQSLALMCVDSNSPAIWIGSEVIAFH